MKEVCPKQFAPTTSVGQTILEQPPASFKEFKG